MGVIKSKRFTQEASEQMRKADALYELVERIVNKMDEIDNEVIGLVEGGLEGPSVQTAADSYIENREVISDFVKRFAAVAYDIHTSAGNAQRIEEEANSAAGAASR